jgi:hypothetical protein
MFLGTTVEHPARFLPDGGVPPYPAYEHDFFPSSASFFVIFTNALQ